MKNDENNLKELIKRDFQDARKNAGVVPKNFIRLIRTEEVLGDWFLRASNNEISPADLIKKYDSLIENLADYDESDILLDDCHGVIDEMYHEHVDASGPFTEEWASYLKKYAQALLGESQRKYYYRPSPGISLEINYEKRK